MEDQQFPQQPVQIEQQIPVGQTPPNLGPKVRLVLPTKVILGVALGLLVVVLTFVTFKIISQKENVQPNKQTITFWGLWEDEQAMNSLISEYEAKTGVKVQFIKQSEQDFRERLTSSLARGAGPDIFDFHNSWVPMFSSYLSFIPEDVISQTEFQNTFYPTATTDLSLGSKLIGLPLAIDGLGLFVNDEIFNKAGASPPKSWNELRDTAEVLKNAGYRPIALGRTDNVAHWQDIIALMLLQNRADLGKPQGVLAKDALEFFTLFAKDGRFWDETLPPSTQAFAKGEVAMYFGPSWEAAEIKKINPALTFRVVVTPQLPKISPDDKDISWATYWAEGVWEKSRYKRQAWEFLKFLSSQDSLQKLYNGALRQTGVGFPYSRTDLAGNILDDPILGAYVKQAPNARSWYLASSTHDGETGINTKISNVYKEALDSILKGSNADSALQTLSGKLSQILTSYSQQTR